MMLIRRFIVVRLRKCICSVLKLERIFVCENEVIGFFQFIKVHTLTACCLYKRKYVINNIFYKMPTI